MWVCGHVCLCVCRIQSNTYKRRQLKIIVSSVCSWNINLPMADCFGFLDLFCFVLISVLLFVVSYGSVFCFVEFVLSNSAIIPT